MTINKATIEAVAVTFNQGHKAVMKDYAACLFLIQQAGDTSKETQQVITELFQAAGYSQSTAYRRSGLSMKLAHKVSLPVINDWLAAHTQQKQLTLASDTAALTGLQSIDAITQELALMGIATQGELEVFIKPVKQSKPHSPDVEPATTVAPEAEPQPEPQAFDAAETITFTTVDDLAQQLLTLHGETFALLLADKLFAATETKQLAA